MLALVARVGLGVAARARPLRVVATIRGIGRATARLCARRCRYWTTGGSCEGGGPRRLSRLRCGFTTWADAKF
jgi:hypothetical protein